MAAMSLPRIGIVAVPSAQATAAGIQEARDRKDVVSVTERSVDEVAARDVAANLVHGNGHAARTRL